MFRVTGQIPEREGKAETKSLEFCLKKGTGQPKLGNKIKNSTITKPELAA